MADGLTFFTGSLFFTAAGYGQCLQAHQTGGPARRDRQWWAALIQLAGTVFFNASTLHALASNLGAIQQDQMVWRPDAYGSACFLVASGLSLHVFGNRWLSFGCRGDPTSAMVDRGGQHERLSGIRGFSSGLVRDSRLRLASQRHAGKCRDLPRRLVFPRRRLPAPASFHPSWVMRMT
ncbi:MAG: hypothetical protein M3Y33_00910 [Actinomycetota bacterium]|nr:hypothetical protein [Actinomycetota bacterium]